jgi:DNA (cytosine-5)-methyltransferase 1
MSTMQVPVVDLFAGPGGLGEGFSSCLRSNGDYMFNIVLSIEKDPEAIRTLTWRAFYRAFKKNGKAVPKAYYEVAKLQSDKERRLRIQEVLSNSHEGQEAISEVKQIELGSECSSDDEVDSLIRERLNGAKDWILIGGPPCQAYSNVGRSRVGGISPDDHRVYLYQQYLRIIEAHRPSVFVMENVQGLLSAQINGASVFEQILEDLSIDGAYQIHSFVRPVGKNRDYLIKSEDYGVPQKRHRVILLGLRSDIKHNGVFLNPKEQVDLKSVIGNLPPIRSGLSKRFVEFSVSRTYATGRRARLYSSVEDSFENWMNAIHSCHLELGSSELAHLAKTYALKDLSRGGEFINGAYDVDRDLSLYTWYSDPLLGGVPNHFSRDHQWDDLKRYFFAALFSKKYCRFPRLEDYRFFSSELLPKHENAHTDKFNDRFRVQLPNVPATTVTSHISKDGHYFIHYDPEQCRAFTVREAARVQTFPDNYVFLGSRTAQFHQVGNAVPPFLAHQLAEVVASVLVSNGKLPRISRK